MATGRRAAAALAAAALMTATAAAGCGSGEDEGGETTSPLADPAATKAAPEAPAQVPAAGDELAPDSEQQVAAATRAYIAALNADDGAAVCALLAPEALDGVRLPRDAGGCARSVEASIGYRGPGGTPAWNGTKAFELEAVSVGSGEARVTATVSHDLGREFPSVEEDVIYLRLSGEKWLLAKPSASFYRAVGYPEPPLSSLTPP